jgi:O-antigen/teichoic acid export membrane protein
MLAKASGSSSTTEGAGGLGQVVRGFGALAGASLVSQVIGFAALAIVARRTGAANLGAYTFALLLATYVNFFASLGVDYLAMRDIAQDRGSVGSILGETLVLQGFLSTVLYIALVAAAPLLAANHEVQRLIPIMGLTLLTSTFTLDWALLALGRSRSVALWRLVGQVVYAALVPAFVIKGESGIFHYAWLNILGIVITSVGLIWVLARVADGKPHVSAPRDLMRRLRRSIPFGYSLVMIQIYTGVSTLMLGYLDSTASVGVYAVASKLPWALITFANLWLNVFFPHTAQRLVADPRGFAIDLGRVVTATIVLAAAATVGAILCAGTLMATMFGSSFQSASAPFALLSSAAALVLLQANFSNVLLAGGSQRYYAAVMTIAAAAVVLLNLLLIPALGTVGAATSSLCAELGITALTLMGVRRRIGPVPLDVDRLLRGAAAVSAMALAMIGARSIGSAIVQIGIGLPAFVAAAWAFRVFDSDFIRQ